MQAEVKDFNPPYMVRFLAVSRTYFCADLTNVVKERKHRTGTAARPKEVLLGGRAPTPRQPALRPQYAPPSV